jgi:hypothetical protein
VLYLVQEESDSEHNKLVRELRRQVHSLDLIVYTRGGMFSKGFTPDIVTNIGGTIHDWVLIEVINSQRMLKHDLGGLYIVNTNLKDEGQSIRKNIIMVSSTNITHNQWCDTLPLVEQLRSLRQSNFIAIWSKDVNYFTDFLKQTIREHLIENIENVNEELISHYFEKG